MKKAPKFVSAGVITEPTINAKVTIIEALEFTIHSDDSDGEKDADGVKRNGKAKMQKPKQNPKMTSL